MAANESSVEIMRKQLSPVLQRAKSLVIRTATDRGDAKVFLVNVKKAQEQVHMRFDPTVDKAHKAWKEAVALRASFLKPLEEAETHVKRLIASWDQEQERLRLEEERRLQALADEAARKERERLEREAARIKTPERREAKLEQAASIVAPVITISAPEKPKGEATRKLWRARLTDKAVLIAAAAQGNELAATCLSFDQTAANKMASATKGSVPIPGVEFYCETVLAVSRYENGGE